MLLVDKEIKELISQGFIKNTSLKNVGPASLDLAIKGPFMFPLGSEPIILSEGDHRVFKTFQKEIILPPRSYCLCASKEIFALPKNISVFVQTRSSCARLGVHHLTAGFIDPSFNGPITFEFDNVNNETPVIIREDDVLVQVVFQIHSDSDGYKGRYQNSEGVEVSKGAR